MQKAWAIESVSELLAGCVLSWGLRDGGALSVKTPVTGECEQVS